MTKQTIVATYDTPMGQFYATYTYHPDDPEQGTGTLELGHVYYEYTSVTESVPRAALEMLENIAMDEVFFGGAE